MNFWLCRFRGAMGSTFPNSKPSKCRGSRFDNRRHASRIRICQKVLAMPCKRYEKRTIDYLTLAEIETLIAAADQQPALADEIRCFCCSPCKPAFACRS